MRKVLLSVEGAATVADLVAVTHFEDGRSSLEVRSKQTITRGRSCRLRNEHGNGLDCVVSNATKEGDVFVLDLRTVEDATFLTNAGSSRR